jgi:hypothetical protein
MARAMRDSNSLQCLTGRGFMHRWCPATTQFALASLPCRPLVQQMLSVTVDAHTLNAHIHCAEAGRIDTHALGARCLTVVYINCLPIHKQHSTGKKGCMRSSVPAPYN